MPIRTAEMKEPETPPIQIASSSTKLVSVERPKVTGSSNAMPNVALRPGIAPKTMPSATIAKMSTRLMGLRQISRAEPYRARFDICCPLPYLKMMPAGSLTWKPNTNIAYKPAVTSTEMSTALTGLT